MKGVFNPPILNLENFISHAIKLSSWLHYFEILLIIYEVLHCLSQPDYLSSSMTMLEQPCLLRSSSSCLVLISFSFCIGDRAFLVTAPKLWNVLNCSSYNIAPIKCSLKTHFYSFPVSQIKKKSLSLPSILLYFLTVYFFIFSGLFLFSGAY